jgi:ribose/xylose/arabinose/galactoside ABC-type transport system permease subunit
MTAVTEVKQTNFRQTLDWDVMWERYGITAILLLVWIVAAFFTPNFASKDNFLNVLRQGSFIGVAAVGMTIAIISGTFDLSVGTALALCAWIVIWVAARFGVAASLVAGVTVGLLVGLANGLLVSKVRIPAFVTTLGMYYIVRGIAFIISEGAPATFSGKSFVWMGNGSIWFLPVPFIVMVVCALVGYAILHSTTFGRYVYAIGTNKLAAMVSGVPIQQATVVVFMVIGLFNSLSAILIGSRLYSATASLEPGFELKVIATVVLGGTRLAGGRGSMLGTVAAALLFATLSNVLNLVHAEPFVQRVLEGLVLLVALSIEGIRQRIAERVSRTKEVKIES